MTIGKIEDKDCQDRETVNIDGKRYVVTDKNVKLTAISKDGVFMQVISTTSGIETNIGNYGLENCCILRAFSECQGTFKGYFADIKYYIDSEGIIFPVTATYIVYLFTHKTLFSTFFVIGAIVVSVIALIKGQNNFSMLDSIINVIKFNLMQKEYKYMRGDFNIKHTKKDIHKKK